MKKTIPVVGMACAACAVNVERKLSSLRGIQGASVSLPARSALVDYDPTVISLETMKKNINDIGYDLVIDTGQSVETIEHNAYRILKHKTILSWILAILLMSISMKWLTSWFYKYH
jgi:Cu2+-exporting ATPase